MRLAICGQFFHDPDRWQVLRTEVVPSLLRDRLALRVWSAGCHVGKEPFSVAMLLDEIAPGVSHTIIASDRDADMLQRVRNGGPFHGRDMDQIDPAQFVRYFVPGGPPHFVLPQMRSSIQVVEHDVREAPIGNDFDLILFRNVEPFFTPQVTRTIHRNLSGSLRSNGVLFVGSTERVLHPSECSLEPIGPSFYRKQ